MVSTFSAAPHAGVGAELVVSSTGEQPPAGYKDDVIRSPMVLNVRKVRGRVLVAYAVDAEMPGFKNNRTQVRVIAGFCQPFHLALAIYIDRIQITGLFFISAPLSRLFADADPFSIHSFCLFVFIQISFISPDADVILLFCF